MQLSLVDTRFFFIRLPPFTVSFHSKTAVIIEMLHFEV